MNRLAIAKRNGEPAWVKAQPRKRQSDYERESDLPAPVRWDWSDSLVIAFSIGVVALAVWGAWQ